MSGGIRTDPETVRRDEAIEVIEDDAGFDRRGAGHRVNLENPRKVSGSVNEHPGTARIAGDARAGSPHRDRYLFFRTQCQQSLDIFS